MFLYAMFLVGSQNLVFADAIIAIAGAGESLNMKLEDL
jgi:hypothetical protein